jgi:dynein heavy chain
MPMRETYGAQPPIELLRQTIDSGGFYDRKKFFFKVVAETQFVLACGPPGGGKMPVTPRFFRHFNMIWVTSMSSEAMRKIFVSILSGWAILTRPELAPLTTPLVQTIVESFFRISEDLLPTPVKCHYTFNLRDPSKIVQGILQVHKPWLQDRRGDHKQRLIKLFVNESSRQFRDRLIDDADRKWFDDLIEEKLEQHLRIDPEEADELRGLLFADFLDRNEKAYQEMDDADKVTRALGEFLAEYNMTYPAPMHLVFFADARQHLVRCARIVRQPRGNALLVGVSGVGRKSLSQMAAHICEYECKQIEITRSYGSNEFKEDLKEMMFAVVRNEGKGLVFLFSDTQIVKESFLEDVNNILNSGTVPNLFAPDELEQIVNLTRPLARAAGRLDSRDEIWQHFIQMVRNSMHIVLAFSPVGDAFRARCRQFPSIINCSTIDWYEPWPAEALRDVAELSYSGASSDLGIADLAEALSVMSSFVHVTAAESAAQMFLALRRQTYTTPTSFLELMRIFLDLYGHQKEKLNTRLERYTIGAQKMSETRGVVETLQVQIRQMQPKMVKAAEDTAQLLVQVENDKNAAGEVAKVCAKEESAAAIKAEEANEIKADCQRELDEALPEFYAAVKSLDSLDKKDLVELKGFKKPPELVVTVVSAVALLLGKKESWEEGSKVLSDTKLLETLKNYDKDALAQNQRLTTKMQKYIKNADFVPEKVKNVSTAATSLCMWVRAMDVYGRVSRSIEPKKQKLAEAEASREAAEATANGKRAELKAVTDKVVALEAKLEAAKRKGKKLEDDMETATLKLGRAEKLLAGLGEEAVRWEQASKELETSLSFLVGNVVVAAGFIAYIGPFTMQYRTELVALWVERCMALELNCDPHWALQTVLGDPAEIREWNIWGLPTDTLSTDNAIVLTRGRRWPLMIDPQGQANRWIRRMGVDKNIAVVKLTEKNFFARTRDRNPLWAGRVVGECGGSAGPGAGARAAQGGGEEGRAARLAARLGGYSLFAGVPLLYYDQAPEPPLPPRDLH